MKKIILVVFVSLLGSMPGFAADNSSLEFHVGSGFSPKGDSRSLVEPLLIDSLGRRAGYDPFSEIFPLPFVEIPGSSAGGEAIDNDITGEPGAESVIVSVGPTPPGRNAVQPIPTGIYSLVVFNTVSRSVAYSFDANITDSSGVDEVGGIVRMIGFLAPNSTATYTFNYSPVPGSAVTVVKTVTFPILRRELQAAFQLNQIGDAEFVQHLDKILAEGERALAPRPEEKHEAHEAGKNEQKREGPRKKEAIEKLEEFIHQLAEAARARPEEAREANETGEHEGGGREREHKRFVTHTALAALTGDVLTLIKQLGGEDHRGGRHKGHAGDSH